MELFKLPEQNVGTKATVMLKRLFDLNVVDQTDKYAPHFLRLQLNRLEVWFSFDEPIAFAGRNGSAVLQGKDIGHNRDMHSFKAGTILRTGDYHHIKSMRSQQKFHKLLADEIKKEIIHTSSEVMSSTLGVE